MSVSIPSAALNASRTGRRFTYESVLAVFQHVFLTLLIRGIDRTRPTDVALDRSDLSWLPFFSDAVTPAFQVPPIAVHGYWETGTDKDTVRNRFESGSSAFPGSNAQGDWADAAEDFIGIEFIGDSERSDATFIVETGVGYDYEFTTPTDSLVIASRIARAYNRLSPISDPFTSFGAAGNDWPYDATEYSAAYSTRPVDGGTQSVGEFQLSGADLCDMDIAQRKYSGQLQPPRVGQTTTSRATLPSGIAIDGPLRTSEVLIDRIGAWGLDSPGEENITAYAFAHAHSTATVDI